MDIQLVDGLVLGQNVVEIQTVVLVCREYILLLKSFKFRVNFQKVAA